MSSMQRVDVEPIVAIKNEGIKPSSISFLIYYSICYSDMKYSSANPIFSKGNLLIR